jgi:hypothetical protein
MKQIALYLAAIATLFCISAKAETAPSPLVQLKFFIYSLPLQEGIDFMVTDNPAGNASPTFDKMDALVAANKATLIDSPILKGESGSHLNVKSQASAVETEAVASKDNCAVIINSQIDVDGTRMLGQQTASFGHEIFNGALKTSDGKSLIVVYVLPFLK